MAKGDDNKELTFLEHLEELRERLFKCLIALVIGFVACYIFSEEIFHILLRPLVKVLPQERTLIFTGLPETFFTYLKTSLLAGFFITSPFILYQLWRFISPGLYRYERRYAIYFVIFSTIFFMGGALFGYFIVFPIAFNFFMGFATSSIQPSPKVGEYFSLASKLLLGFGVVFELPLLIFFLAKAGIVEIDTLRKGRKYAILLIFITAAFLTPPDVISQILMALPLIILYEIGILFARISIRGPEHSEDRSQNSEVRS